MERVIKGQLAALKSAAALSNVRDADIYATANLNLVPEGVKSPFIAVKDGPVTVRELTCNLIEKTGRSTVAVYVQLDKKEASIIGDDSASKKGVLEIAGDVEGVLRGNLLSVSGMQAAMLNGSTESETFLNADGTKILRKKINITYVWEE